MLEIYKLQEFVSYNDLSALNGISASDAQKQLPETTRQLMGKLLRTTAGDRWKLVAPIDRVAGNNQGMKIYWNKGFITLPIVMDISASREEPFFYRIGFRNRNVMAAIGFYSADFHVR